MLLIVHGSPLLELKHYDLFETAMHLLIAFWQEPEKAVIAVFKRVTDNSSERSAWQEDP